MSCNKGFDIETTRLKDSRNSANDTRLVVSKTTQDLSALDRLSFGSVMDDVGNSLLYRRSLWIRISAAAVSFKGGSTV